MAKIITGGLCLLFALGTPTDIEEPVEIAVHHQYQNATIEQIVGNFSADEKSILLEALADINRTYPIDLRIAVLKAEMDELGGEAYTALNDSSFKKRYGEETFNLLKGKNVIVLDNLDNYQPKEENIWNSLYMPNPSSHKLYKRSILHEIGHIICDAISTPESTPELEKALFDIDVNNKVATQGSEKAHPAHPSFYTFLYAGSEEFDEKMHQKNTNETFADVFALQVLGCLDNVQDPLLQRKIQLIEEAIRRYTEPYDFLKFYK